MAKRKNKAHENGVSGIHALIIGLSVLCLFVSAVVGLTQPNYDDAVKDIAGRCAAKERVEDIFKSVGQDFDKRDEMIGKLAIGLKALSESIESKKVKK